ncbi:hypothetical protein N6H14_14895 [Paenibacillus sp. CC-CFT747]|nr:hypothetical protein N6H14_14895 [Paenibacillus sp. CC-CFT747]
MERQESNYFENQGRETFKYSIGIDGIILIQDDQEIIEIKDRSSLELDLVLSSIGKKFFIDYYDKLKDDKLTYKEIVDSLPSSFKRKSKVSRVSNSKRIFRQGLQIEALKNIINSKRIDSKTRQTARGFLEKELL